MSVDVTYFAQKLASGIVSLAKNFKKKIKHVNAIMHLNDICFVPFWPNQENYHYMQITLLTCTLGQYITVLDNTGKRTQVKKECLFLFSLNSCAGLNTKQLVKGQCSSINPCHPYPCSDNEL